ncbi:phage protein Gp13 family protein [Blastochloris tepida]|uniref:N-acetyltransferase domain-containing protein n=1 Tax=Blastochloris tepida TaxID=2233851 RepID=A0A348FZV8_9HYPH|nr:phage protein Gp13 family protein [Blastochloris tepida]BBF92841.1 hypothetical protein BLTE_15260 [Blastochloris tepida]
MPVDTTRRTHAAGRPGSGVRLEIVPAEPAHIPAIAQRMRSADVAEVRAASGLSPADALRFGLSKSSACFTALVDGRPEIMFGVGDMDAASGIGCVWLLGTDAVDRHFRLFLRQSVEWLRKLLSRYSVLRNFVSDDNAVSKRWLRWLGAEFGAPIEHRGTRFLPFELMS